MNLLWQDWEMHDSQHKLSLLVFSSALLFTILFVLFTGSQGELAPTVQAATIDPPIGTLIVSDNIPIAYDIEANNGSGLRLAPFEYYVQQGDGSATQGVNCGPATVAMALRYASGGLLELTPSQIRRAYIPTHTPASPITTSFTTTTTAAPTSTLALSATLSNTIPITQSYTNGFTTIPELNNALRKLGAKTQLTNSVTAIWQAIESYHTVITPVRMRDISLGEDTKALTGNFCPNGKNALQIGTTYFCANDPGALFTGKYVEFPYGDGRWDGHIVLLNGIFTDEMGQRYFYVYDPNVFTNDPRLYYYFGDTGMAKGQFRLWKYEEVESGLRNNGGWALVVENNPADPITGVNLETIRATLDAISPARPSNESFTFINHESYPSGVSLNPGEFVLKRWRIRNSGESDIGLNYQLVQASGVTMLIHGESTIGQILRGDEAIISAYLQVPQEPGNYSTVWNIVNAAGEPIRGSMRFDFTVSGANQTGSDSAKFTGQETPNGDVVLGPNETFQKTWRVINNGSRSWTADYHLVLMQGDLLGTLAENPVPLVYPGETVDLSLYITTPDQPGNYRSVWQLRNDKGEFFGPRLTLQLEVK